MDAKSYTVYRCHRFGARRSGREKASASIAIGSATTTRASDAKRRSSCNSNRFSGTWFIRKATALAIIVGALLIGYAAWVFGYGYYDALAGQADLRSMFSLTGNGSVDPDYLRGEAAALEKRLGYLDPVGEISIPRIGVELMVVEGSDKAALAKGPGHIAETSLPGAGGNFAVAGDRVLYGAPFLNLDEVEPGDEVSVRMPYATFVYRVSEIFIVTPDEVSVLQPVGYEAITLITCDPPWDIKQRIVVRGELAEVLPVR